MKPEQNFIPSIHVNARHNTSGNSDEIVINAENVITALGFPIEQELWCRVVDHSRSRIVTHIYTEEETFVPRGCSTRYHFDGNDMHALLKLNRSDLKPRRFEIARKAHIPETELHPEMVLIAEGANSARETLIQFTIEAPKEYLTTAEPEASTEAIEMVVSGSITKSGIGINCPDEVRQALGFSIGQAYQVTKTYNEDRSIVTLNGGPEFQQGRSLKAGYPLRWNLRWDQLEWKSDDAGQKIDIPLTIIPGEDWKAILDLSSVNRHA